MIDRWREREREREREKEREIYRHFFVKLKISTVTTFKTYGRTEKVDYRGAPLLKSNRITNKKYIRSQERMSYTATRPERL